ncbi:MAG: hypothetical protein KGO21_01905 [Hyphomicrobiales bacterium]|nr:hypothetical protein [Hyphomicrobiales bacterium]
MIVNIFDMRADHMAVDPIDAVLVAYDSRVDRNGVTVVDVIWDAPQTRESISVTDAITWAAGKPEPIALMIYDAASCCSYLAQLRMEIRGAAERVLNRVAIRRPPEGMLLTANRDAKQKGAVEQ